VGVELFHADGRTNMTKLTVAFQIIANGSKNEEQENIFTDIEECLSETNTHTIWTPEPCGCVLCKRDHILLLNDKVGNEGAFLYGSR
jgi:hypothetical protein